MKLVDSREVSAVAGFIEANPQIGLWKRRRPTLVHLYSLTHRKLQALTFPESEPMTVSIVFMFLESIKIRSIANVPQTDDNVLLPRGRQNFPWSEVCRIQPSTTQMVVSPQSLGLLGPKTRQPGQNQALVWRCGSRFSRTRPGAACFHLFNVSLPCSMQRRVTLDPPSHG